MYAECLKRIIAHAVLCEVLLIWWRPILNFAVDPYRNFIGNHMIRLTVGHKTVHSFIRKILLISEWHLHIFGFEPQETNRTKILRKLWCARLQIGVESVKGEEGTLAYLPAFSLPLVLENSSQSFIEYTNIQIYLCILESAWADIECRTMTLAVSRLPYNEIEEYNLNILSLTKHISIITFTNCTAFE